MKHLYSLFSALVLAFSAQAQNNCASALTVTLGQYIVDGVNGQTLNFSCGGPVPTNAAEWYVFTPENDITVTISSAIEPYEDTRLFVFTGTCDALICHAFNDDGGPGFSSILTTPLTGGTTYYIVWDAFWNSDPFNFSISEAIIVPSLINFNHQMLGSGQHSAADINGDKLDDIMWVSNQVAIKLQQPDGSFQDLSVPYNNLTHSPSWSLAAGDMNNDNWTDIVCGGGGGVSILMSQNGGTSYQEFTVPDYVFSQRSNCIDIDNDGLLDAFVCHDVEPNVRFINNGNGTFAFSQGGLGDTPNGGNYGSVWIDYDNDCDMDLFLAKCKGGMSEASRNQLHRNNGDGTFTEVSDESGLSDYVQTWSSAWADYDNDGDMDVVVGASSFVTGGHRVMRNNGDGTFTNVAIGSGFDTFTGSGIEYIPADFNNDGFVDVLGGGNYIAVNNGDMTFTHTEIVSYPGPLGDLNNDGFIDIVNDGGVYFNLGNDNNYIKVATVGTVSNPQGIGARVTVYTPNGQQIREIRSGEGFRYMGSLNAHFGLGEETEVTKITICWPSGIEDEILNPDINTLHIIEEGSSVPSYIREDQNKLSIFPNPATEHITLKNAERFIGGNLTVTDATGRIVLSETFHSPTMSIESLNTGLYNLRLTKNGQVLTEPFIKQ